MPVQFNHTIVWCHDKAASAGYLAEILDLPAPEPFLHFMVVRLDNGASLDFMEKQGPVSTQHYAFLVEDAAFAPLVERLKAKGLDWWADPARTRPGETNSHFGGRGVYFEDPNGHLMEAITRPYS
jgi:catechol 2,3-dioxygenase-like lactoylglutathione lyase family enzyme